MCEKRTSQDDNAEGRDWVGVFLHSLGNISRIRYRVEFQLELLCDKFERYWDFYEMFVDYYAKYPDLELKIVKKDVEGDDGRGKQPAGEEVDESSDD